MSLYSTLRNRFAANQPASTVDWNIRYLYLEIVFASILGGITVYFNAPFAIRLGASEQLIAFLTAAPSLIAAVASIPSARFMAKRRKRKLWMFGSLFVLRLGYLAVAAIPLLFKQHTALVLVLWIVALNLPSIFFTNGFQVLQAELIPENRRAFVFSRRSILYSLMLVLVTTLVGGFLDQYQDQFPLNYQLLYIFGFITVLGSNYFLNRLTVPDVEPVKHTTVAVTEPAERVEMSLPMRRMLVNTALYYFGLNLAGPLYNIYYIETLKVSDGWLGVNASAASIGVVIGYLMWERMIRTRSFTWAQRRATVATWFFPLTLALIPGVITNLDVGLPLIMIMNVIVNMMHSGVELSNLNVLLKLSKPEERAAYVSWYNTVFFGVAFIAPLVGAWLAGPLGFPMVFFLTAVLRLAGGVLFNINRVDKDLPRLSGRL
ncbi:MAG: MFS transporter [Anaerolineae bacterium]|nr:MFS transporter [Anaerolineae bacterium]